MSASSQTAAAALVGQAATADGAAATRWRSALSETEQSICAIRRAVVALAGVVLVLAVALVIVGFLGVRNAQNTVDLCELRVQSLITSADVRRKQARQIVPGPNLDERRSLLLTQAHDLDEQARLARCEQRFQLP